MYIHIGQAELSVHRFCMRVHVHVQKISFCTCLHMRIRPIKIAHIFAHVQLLLFCTCAIQKSHVQMHPITSYVLLTERSVSDE